MKAEWEEGQGSSLLQKEALAEETMKTEAVPAQAEPASIVEDAGREAAEREEYWNSVLTGDVATIPREVRREAEAMYAPGMADGERVAACVMQSWVADTGGIPRERIRKEWGRIREQVARQYGASGKSDNELFVAVSQHNQVRLSQRETLFELYQEAYDRVLAGTSEEPDERRLEAVSRWPEDLRSVAEKMRSRAVSDALDDRNRLSEAADMIRKGLEGLVANEAPPEGGFPAVQVNWNPVKGIPDVVRAVDCLAGLGGDDRQKVFRMMAPYMRSRPGFRTALESALKRGTAETAENVGQFAVNGAAWVMPDGKTKEALDRYSRSFEELRNFARLEFAPLRGGKDAPWFREMMVDMAQQGASTALAFAGPAGLGVLMAGETGRIHGAGVCRTRGAWRADGRGNGAAYGGCAAHESGRRL